MFINCSKFYAVVILLMTIWIFDRVISENDINTCSFHYWKVDWHYAVQRCQADNKQLLCYKSKKEIDDITEAFKLSSSFGEAELELWLSNRNCSRFDEMESCLSLHIEKSSLGVWHYFQTSCKQRFPFICCINGTGVEQTTATSSEKQTITSSLTSDVFDPTVVSTDSMPSTNYYRYLHCKRVRKRGLLWPDTMVGKTAVLPCPGKSIGTARWTCEHSETGQWSKDGPDMSECRSLEVQNLKDKFNTSSASEFIDDLERIFKDHDREVFGEDMVDVISLMASLPDRLFLEMESFSSEARWTSTRKSVLKSMSVLDRLIELNATWIDIKEKRRSGVGTSLLSTIDGMGSVLADTMEESTEQSFFGKNVAMQVLRTYRGESVQFPQWTVSSHYNQRGSIVLDEGYDSDVDISKGDIFMVFALYNDMAVILSPGKQTASESKPTSLNSAVISATVTQARKPLTIKKQAKIIVEHLVDNPNDTACVFWNMQLNLWDTTGCRLANTNESYSMCTCDHLTNFALLMDYREVLDQVDQLPFHFITLVGCTISIFSLIICVVIFSCYSYHTRHSWAMRSVIHRNLCLALLIANLVLIFGLDRTENRKVCAVVAGLLHYFFLSAFSWMFLEGVHIYLLLIIVFASRRSHSEKYYLFGYGFPLIVVIITAVSRPTYYGTNEVCWLSTEKGTIWGFMGPVAAILMLNTAALILAQWKASRISIKNDNIGMVKRWLRVTIILFPILGITWIFGFLYVGKHFEVAGYLFAFFNSFQGFCIFVFHCLLDKKARNMILTFKKKNASVYTGSSGTQKKGRSPLELQNEPSPNTLPVDSDNQRKHHVFQKVFCLPIRDSWKRDWSKWRKPWSFCFEMPVTDQSNQSNTQANKEPPIAVAVNWNDLSDKI